MTSSSRSRIVRNFMWQREDEPQNLLTYLMLFVNLIYGVTFTFFTHTAVVQASPFVTAALNPMLWGLACLILVVLTVVTIALRPRRLGQAMGFLGVLVWGYGLVLYLLSGSLFAALVLYLPQLVFWGFWYIGVRRYYFKEEVKKVIT